MPNGIQVFELDGSSYWLRDLDISLRRPVGQPSALLQGPVVSYRHYDSIFLLVSLVFQIFLFYAVVPIPSSSASALYTRASTPSAP